MKPHLLPQNCPFLCGKGGGSGLYLMGYIVSSLGPMSPHTKRHLDRFSRFCRGHGLGQHTQADHATSVALRHGVESKWIMFVCRGQHTQADHATVALLHGVESKWMMFVCAVYAGQAGGHSGAGQQRQNVTHQSTARSGTVQ